MEYFAQYGLFLAKAVTLVAAILIVVIGFVVVSQRQRGESRGHIEVRHLNEHYRDLGRAIRDAVTDKELLRIESKAEQKADKAKAKAAKKAAKSGAAEPAKERKPRLFTLNFQGDIKASAAASLREEVSAVLAQIEAQDAVLVLIESPGGQVPGYGLAASQLQRLRDAGVKLTVAVDKVAASGGYLMACVAEEIIAAPFAVLGSIGVVAVVPNVHALLKKNDVDVEMFTAGKYKRTVTMFGKNDDEGRRKFNEELEAIHVLFQNHVQRNRPSLDVQAVATGEAWFGQDALDRGLVDALQTSDDYLQARAKDWDIYEVSYVLKKSWQEKMGLATASAFENVLLKLWQRNQGPHV